MPSTNKTDKLQLSQFEATDKPSFIQDYNADMAKIEQAMESAKINVVAPLKVSESAKASSNDSVALGTSAKATSGFSVALGSNASSAGTSVAVGGYASATSSSCVALGTSAKATANCSVALGTGASAGEGSVALGNSAKAPNDNSVALGCHAEVANDNSVALGQGASTKRVSEVSIGNTNGDNSNGDLPRTRLLANVTDPELDQDAATKHYVDSAVQNATASAQACIDMQFYHSNSTQEVQFNSLSYQPVTIKLPPLKKSVGEECTTVDSSGKLVINKTGVYLIECNFNFGDFSGEAEENFTIIPQISPGYISYENTVYSYFSTISPGPSPANPNDPYVSCRVSPIVLTVDTAPMKFYFQVSPLQKIQDARTAKYGEVSCVVMRLHK